MPEPPDTTRVDFELHIPKFRKDAVREYAAQHRLSLNAAGNILIAAGLYAEAKKVDPEFPPDAAKPARTPRRSTQ